MLKMSQEYSPATTPRHPNPVQVVSVIKIDPDPLTEAEKWDILKKKKNEHPKKKLKRRLHKMSEQERKTRI